MSLSQTLLHEDLARARRDDRRVQAEHDRLVRLAVQARRERRRNAHRVVMVTRRLLAAVVVR